MIADRALHKERDVDSKPAGVDEWWKGSVWEGPAAGLKPRQWVCAGFLLLLMVLSVLWPAPSPISSDSSSSSRPIKTPIPTAIPPPSISRETQEEVRRQTEEVKKQSETVKKVLEGEESRKKEEDKRQKAEKERTRNENMRTEAEQSRGAAYV